MLPPSRRIDDEEHLLECPGVPGDRQPCCIDGLDRACGDDDDPLRRGRSKAA
jgi:hypothetical protein